MLSIAAGETQCLNIVIVSRCCSTLCSPMPRKDWRDEDALAGLLLLTFFFLSSRLGSWLSIESACWTCCVCDIATQLSSSEGRWCGKGGVERVVYVASRSFTSDVSASARDGVREVACPARNASPSAR